MDSVKLRRELQVSQLLCYKMTENVEKITFASEKGEKPLGTFINTDSKFLSYQLFAVVKLDLIIRTEQHLSIAVQYVRGNSEIKIKEHQNQYQTCFIW